MKSIRLLPWALALLAIAGCYRAVEGCLDPEAKNFDVAADKNCCCEYPVIKLSVDFRENDSTGLSLDKVFNDAAGHPFRIQKIAFFLSDIQIAYSNGTAITLGDTVQAWTYGAGNKPERREVSSGLAFFSTSVRSAVFDNRFSASQLAQLKFFAGLTANQKAVIPDSLDQDFPLATVQDSMWLGPKKFAAQKWIIRTDTSSSAPVSDTFFVVQDAIPVELTYTNPLILQKGKDLEIKIGVNVSKWVQNIDWHGGSQEIIEKLAANSANAFSLVQ